MANFKHHTKTLVHKPVKAARKVHHHVAKRPHEYLLQRSSRYRQWHEFRFHDHIHTTLTVLGIVVIAGAIGSATHQTFALSTWVQSDWSGGVGSSTANQYSTASNAITSTANQVTQSMSTNLVQNPNFATNLNNWQGGLLPSSITGLESWYHADSITGVSNGGSVTSWVDSSGNGHNLSQNTGSNEPILETSDINGQPAVRFNGTSDYMGGTASGFTNASTVFTEQTIRSSVTGGTFEFGVNSGVNTGISLLPWGGTMYSRSYGITPNDITWSYSTPATNIISQEYNGASNTGQAWQDGVSKGTVSTNSSYGSTINTLTVGALTPSAYFEPVDVGELIAYSAALTTTQRQAIEGYLANKYDDTAANYVTATQDTSVAYTGDTASAKLVSGTNGGDFVQYINTGNTSSYNLSAYAYNGGSAVTSSVAQLYYNGSAITTTYTSVGSGWYRLSASVNGINASTPYGVYVAPSQTIHVDNVGLALPPPSGTLTSNIFDTGVAENWGNLTYSATVPTNTTVSVLVRAGNQANLSDASAFTSCSAITSGNAITSACAPNKSRYVQYQLQFTSDGSASATFSSITIAYSPSDIIPPPTNASSLLMFRSNGGASVSSDGWTNTDPYFTWTAGADDMGGSGILGYCLYLGQDPTGNPVTTKGDLGTSPVNTGGACQFAVSSASIDTSISGYIGTALTSSSSPYYLNIKAIDNADNVYTGSSAQFEFMYDNTPPTNPAFISAPSEFVSSKDVTLTWPTTGGDAASDANSGIAGLQYRIGSSGTWYGVNHNGNQDATDLLANSGSYETVSSPDFANLVQGNNIIYFRTWDNAGNISTAYVTTVVKINSTAPSSPQNLTATPTTNSTNSFAFNWLVPATFTGSASNITYCYTVNVLPSSSNCTFTAAGVTSLDAGAYATEPGDNTFYVVAKDEAGNINYATEADTTFTANTPAPGVPLNMDIADISVKATSNWKLALSWEAPSDTGAGVSTYKVFRSSNGVTFTDIASTGGTSYVDSGLNQQTYYYKVEACDSANNCGVQTSVVSLLPTGKFTSPANLISGPDSSVTTRTATVTWTTDRDSDSSIEYGLSSGHYFDNDVSNSDQVTSHTVTLNSLTAGTTYYYRAEWTDVDGNTGTSAEGTFTTLPAPTVSNVETGNINLHSATIQFTSSNATAVQLQYGGGVLSNTQKLNTSTSTSTYSIPLSGLTAGTTYTFRLDPYDTSGNSYVSTETHTFTTPPQPTITNIQFSPVTGALTGSEQITWTTNVPATSQISYGLVNAPQSNQLDTTFTTNHSMTVSGLSYNTQYSVTATSVDELGNVATSDLQVFKSGTDTRPPITSDVTIQPSIVGSGASAKGQLVVSWRTDKAGTSQVTYGQGAAGDYSSKTSENTELVNNHVVVITGIATSQVYHLQVLSKDAEGVQGASPDQTTIIGQASDNALSIVFNALQSIFGL